MQVFIIASFLLSTLTGPLDEALEATEAPNTVRVAFTVELKSDRARQVFAFDPRAEVGERWRFVEAEGDDGDLDAAAAAWGAEAAPDGRLFPDDLRASLGEEVSAEDLGGAWRLRFRHRPSANDGEFDVWAAERLDAVAWLDPVADRFLRVDYALPRPVRGPDGGRLTRFDQSYFLETEPRFGLSLVTAFAIEIEGRAAFRRVRRSYSARVLEAEIFFATPNDEASFVAARKKPAGRRGPKR